MINIDSHSELICAAKKMVKYASQKNIDLRLFGSVGIGIYCQSNGIIIDETCFKDIDFVGKIEQLNKANEVINDLGFTMTHFQYSKNGEHRVYKSITGKYSRELSIDIYFGMLTFNHTIPPPYFDNVNKYTIPPTQLLISKLAIVEITEKDKKDIALLLHQLLIGNENTTTTIKEGYLVEILCRSCQGWEISQTVIKNLNSVKTYLCNITSIDNSIHNTIMEKIETLTIIIEQSDKSLTWRIRKFIGTKVKHYKEAN